MLFNNKKTEDSDNISNPEKNIRKKRWFSKSADKPKEENIKTELKKEGKKIFGFKFDKKAEKDDETSTLSADKKPKFSFFKKKLIEEKDITQAESEITGEGENQKKKLFSKFAFRSKKDLDTEAENKATTEKPKFSFFKKKLIQEKDITQAESEITGEGENQKKKLFSKFAFRSKKDHDTEAENKVTTEKPKFSFFKKKQIEEKDITQAESEITGEGENQKKKLFSKFAFRSKKDQDTEAENKVTTEKPKFSFFKKKAEQQQEGIITKGDNNSELKNGKKKLFSMFKFGKTKISEEKSEQQGAVHKVKFSFLRDKKQPHGEQAGKEVKQDHDVGSSNTDSSDTQDKKKWNFSFFKKHRLLKLTDQANENTGEQTAEKIEKKGIFTKFRFRKKNEKINSEALDKDKGVTKKGILTKFRFRKKSVQKVVNNEATAESALKKGFFAKIGIKKKGDQNSSTTQSPLGTKTEKKHFKNIKITLFKRKTQKSKNKEVKTSKSENQQKKIFGFISKKKEVEIQLRPDYSKVVSAISRDNQEVVAKLLQKQKEKNKIVKQDHLIRESIISFFDKSDLNKIQKYLGEKGQKKIDSEQAEFSEPISKAPKFIQTYQKKINKKISQNITKVKKIDELEQKAKKARRVIFIRSRNHTYTKPVQKFSSQSIIANKTHEIAIYNKKIRAKVKVMTDNKICKKVIMPMKIITSPFFSIRHEKLFKKYRTEFFITLVIIIIVIIILIVLFLTFI